MPDVMPAASLRDRLDRIGVFTAALCAIHCAAMPLAFASISSLTLALYSWQHPDHRWAVLLLRISRREGAVVAFALLNAALSLLLGWWRHRDARPGMLGGLAAAMFLLALVSPWSAAPLLHAAFAVAGGAGLSAAHLLNLRVARRSRMAG